MLRAAAIVLVLWALPLGLAIWAISTGHVIIASVLAAWCLIGSRRVVPVIREAAARRRST